MKIYNTSIFEKLKIRSVNINNINYSGIDKIDPKTISITDLEPGYIIKTKKTNSNPLYMVVDQKTEMELNHNPIRHNYRIFFIQPKEFNEISSLTVESYEETWPHHKWSDSCDVCAVYLVKQTHNILSIHTFDEFIKIYNEYIKIITNNENI